MCLVKRSHNERFAVVFSIWKTCLLLLLTCGLQFLAGGAARPSELYAEDARKLVEKLPDHSGFGYSGLRFYQQKLYATSGIGLLEFEGASLKHLYRWNKSDGDVEGGWLNLADNELWVWLPGNDRLARFDGTTWRFVPMPRPSRGFFSRGDILDGFDGIRSSSAFWLSGAGCAWRWDSVHQKWTKQLDLPVFQQSARPALGTSVPGRRTTIRGGTLRTGLEDSETRPRQTHRG